MSAAPQRIVIRMWRGLVTEVIGDVPLEVTIINADDDGGDPMARLVPGLGSRRVTISQFTHADAPARVEQVYAALVAHRAESGDLPVAEGVKINRK